MLSKILLLTASSHAVGEDWEWCSTEGGTCSCTGTVRYGSATKWTVKSGVTGSIKCNNRIFGDPHFGVVKSCYCWATATATSASASSDPPTCGDGLVTPPETCDDGNTKSGDGCVGTEQPNFCLRVKTGTQGASQGTLDVYVTENSNDKQKVASGFFAKGETVLDKTCYSTHVELSVHNPTNDGWGGTVETSRDGGATWQPVECVRPPPEKVLKGQNRWSAKNLGECNGECDSDSQCRAGLKCFQRENGEKIPGCTGPGGGPTWDYCYNPSFDPSMIPCQVNTKYPGLDHGLSVDGNTDGKSLAYQNCLSGLECNLVSTSPWTHCTQEICGDGILNVGEECDDGNAASCDGCSDSCQVEQCGNSRVECGETCDDGNLNSGDGCSGISRTCLRLTTGTKSDNQGTIDVFVHGTAGKTNVFSGKAAQGTVPLLSCFDDFLALSVANPTNDAWAGSIETSIDEGVTWHHVSRPPTPAGTPLSGPNPGGTELEACTGECDSDSDCREGLKCFQRQRGEPIPGCSGPGGGPTWDYCYDPELESLLNLHDTCARESGCNDPGVVVDGDTDGIDLAYMGCLNGDECTLVSTIVPPVCKQEVCGDAFLDFGEECDDGNVHDGDRCSKDCQWEICGNSRIEGNEQCDDGNIDSGDGCSGKAQTCLRITTGTNSHNQGDLDVFLDDGSGEQLVSTGWHAQGSEVINTCFDDYMKLSVQGPTGDAWSGEIDLSTDGGQTWQPAGCAALDEVPLSGSDDDGAVNLQACTGECDTDEQCAPGLRCYQRQNGEKIPGCSGSGGGQDWDYCYDPNIAGCGRNPACTGSTCTYNGMVVDGDNDAADMAFQTCLNGDKCALATVFVPGGCEVEHSSCKNDVSPYPCRSFKSLADFSVEEHQQADADPKYDIRARILSNRALLAVTDQPWDKLQPSNGDYSHANEFGQDLNGCVFFEDDLRHENRVPLGVHQCPPDPTNSFRPCSPNGEGLMEAINRVTLNHLVNNLDTAGNYIMYYHRIQRNPIPDANLKWIAEGACKIDISVSFECTGSDCVEVQNIVCASFAGIGANNFGKLSIECKVPPSFKVRSTLGGTSGNDDLMAFANAKGHFSEDTDDVTSKPTQSCGNGKCTIDATSKVAIPETGYIEGSATISAEVQSITMTNPAWSGKLDTFHTAKYNLTRASASIKPLSMPIGVNFHTEEGALLAAKDVVGKFPVGLDSVPFLSTQKVELGKIVKPDHGYLRIVAKVAATKHWFLDQKVSGAEKSTDGGVNWADLPHNCSPIKKDDQGDSHTTSNYPQAFFICEKAMSNVNAGDVVRFALSWKIAEVAAAGGSGKAQLLQETPEADPNAQSVEVSVSFQLGGGNTNIVTDTADGAASAGNTVTYIIIAVCIIAAALILTVVVVASLWMRKRSREQLVVMSPKQATVAAVYKISSPHKGEVLDV